MAVNEKDESDNPEDDNFIDSSCLNGGDVLTRSLAFLPLHEIASCRRVSAAWRDAASHVRIDEEVVIENHHYAGLTDMARSCMGRQMRRIRLDQKRIRTQHLPQHGGLVGPEEFSVLCTGFSNLTHLTFRYCAHLEVDFSTMLQSTTCALKNLTHLNLHGNERIEWKLSDLVHLPQLMDVRCINNLRLTGTLRDLAESHPNASQFVTLDVSGCRSVTGDLLDLRSLPQLGWMGLSRTSVEGDLRRVRPSDFPSLRMAGLNDRMYGANAFDSVADAAAVMRARHGWIARSTEECPIWPFRVGLSRNSPEYHERIEQRLYSSERDPPFDIENVQAGNRRGWRWSNYLGGVCRVHWLDPVPVNDSKNILEYQAYLDGLADLQREEERSMFSSFYDPPNPLEYEELCLLDGNANR